MEFDPRRDYPIGERRPDLVTTPAGTPLAAVTLDAVDRGDIPAGDLRASAATLRMQAAVARDASRPQLAAGLERAAELAAVGDEVVLELYTALRPNRSSAADLEGWADRLEQDYGATATAAFVREAATVYARRDLLRRRA